MDRQSRKFSAIEEKENRLERLNDYDNYVERLQKKYRAAEKELEKVTEELSGGKESSDFIEDAIEKDFWN